ncbi:Helitron helicase [Phytophthora megakarya]|uniref:Helitron helicase n=1 Tax=Phytophthora megakarya TaxID=4795 RepID=A0A225UIB7_9STRA|nr:Helitron helicase [Phytophthora megakarya]
MLMYMTDVSIRKSTVNFVFILAMERTRGHPTRLLRPRVNRIYESNPHYDPLQYPLLHPYGESGWTYKLPYASEQNCNNDGDDEGRANYDQTDQIMEGELAEWGYIVQYEDGSEG